ncbi:MAG: hypothetical protein EB023_14890 [Flavobacteriia bacterium]|nr:hypothetical protein [Flavobacteriia bacterium]
MSDYYLYPEKPLLIRKKTKSDWALTVFTMVLFVAIFLFFYKDRAEFIFLLLLVLLIHEFGHYIFMKKFKYENMRMLFVPMLGAFVQGSKPVYSQKESILVCLGGPIPGILFGFVCLIVSSYFHLSWLVLLALIFLFLNVINLLPFDPLDGGQMLKALLIKRHERYSLLFSLISSLVLLVIGLYLKDWVFMIIGMLMGIRVRSMQINYRIHKELAAMDVNYYSVYEDISNRDYYVMKQLIMENNNSAKIYNQLPNEDNDQFMANLVDELLVPPMVFDVSTLGKILVILLWLACLISPIIVYYFIDISWYFETL